MGRYSEWWFSRFSDEWWDLTTSRGFVGGLLSVLLNLLMFFLVFVLALLLGLLSSETGAPGATFDLLFFPTVVGSVLVGAGLVYLAHTSDRVTELTRTFSGRVVAVVAFYGVFVVLLAYNHLLAFWAALAYMAGKTMTLLGIFIAHRV